MSGFDFNNERIEALYPMARDGYEPAIRALRGIYDSGDFDPGFGRDLEAFLTALSVDRYGRTAPLRQAARDA